MQQLTRPVRRATLALHVTVSVGWLGLTLGLLALGLTAYTTGSSETVAAAYRSMKIFIDWLVVPIALLTVVSGVVLSLGTPWGLARYHWVRSKLWLTIVAAGATVFSLRPEIGRAAAAVEAGRPEADFSLVMAPSVALSLYLFCTVISVLKPWGLTRRGRRLRHAQSTAKSASSSAAKAINRHRQPVS